MRVWYSLHQKKQTPICSLDHYTHAYPDEQNIVVTADAQDETGVATSSPLKDKDNFDYRLKPDSQARDAGFDPGSAHGFSLLPQYHYQHNAQEQGRKTNGTALDIGAYEVGGISKAVQIEQENGHTPDLELPEPDSYIRDDWEDPLPVADISKHDVSGDILEVGPDKAYASPGQAAKVAQDGDMVKISPGTYHNDTAVWEADNLIIAGAGGFAYLRCSQKEIENGKAIWVIKGNNTVVENIRFAGARVNEHNGAGIRQEGDNFTLRNCYFHDNENGILAAENKDSNILIEHCEFFSNGYGKGYTHNLYINRVNKLVFRYNYTHQAKIGHNLKSRAQENYILYNRIMDEHNGTASYQIDLPNGRLSYLIGNIMQQGANCENYSLVSYGNEGFSYSSKKLYLVNNSLVNTNTNGNFLFLGDNAQLISKNNIFCGPGTVYKGAAPSSEATNLVVNQNETSNLFTDAKGYDYRLEQGAELAIDQGIYPKSGEEFPLVPQYHYLHPAGKQKRFIRGKIDIGAYEFFEADISGDGILGLEDLVLILKTTAGTNVSIGSDYKYMDVNGDQRLGLAEAVYILERLSEE